ncbi:hypothetical protein [Mycolicibacterium mageritense]|uniref:hypothetical protein n=1 Tax=Mycolicibacterium mageritense TaxID=53462 RepID=UPI000A524691|nr:hypothetical protein [Mycolicibacterium mageritense]MCC9186806.1 hypothetical protein [Mycolicibacterium mageritense]
MTALRDGLSSVYRTLQIPDVGHPCKFLGSVGVEVAFFARSRWVIVCTGLPHFGRWRC